MALATALPPTRLAAPTAVPTGDGPATSAPRPGTRSPGTPARIPAMPAGRPSRAPERRPKLGPVGAPHRVRVAAPPPAPVHLTRRGVLASWVVAALSIAIAVFGLVQGLQPSAPEVVGSQNVVVQPGQTLWEVAKSVNPGIDPRVTLAAIGDGQLRGSALVPGVEISVPQFAAR
mgnify:CR=1 FL=1